MKSPLLAAAALAATLCTALPAQAVVVNIDATKYGFGFPTDPAPVVGQIITPISNGTGGTLNQLTLAAGPYTITNATGLPGADPGFIGWNFSGGWVWSVVIADDATHQVVFYADAGGVQGSQAAIAAQPDVQAFSSSFTLTQATTLDLMIRDYYLPDNAGGVAVSITSAVPEPVSLALMLGGVATLVLRRRR
jgi:hypothetical protein